MSRHSASLTRTVAVVLVLSTTLLLALFASLLVWREHQESMASLRQELRGLAERLAISATLPMWVYDHDQLENLAAGAMTNDNLSAVFIRDNEGRLVCGFGRDQGWTPRPLDTAQGLENDLRATRAIQRQGAALGEVSLYLTPRLAMERLWLFAAQMAGGIALLEFGLAMLLLYLLRRIVLAPIAVLEEYAAGEGAPPLAPDGEARFIGELDRLRQSLHAMVSDLRQAEARYRDMFMHSVDAMFQTTPAGRYLKVNAALARLMEYDSPEDLAGTVTDLGQQVYLDPADRAAFHAILDAQGSVCGFETRMKTKTGRVLWTSLNARRVRREDGFTYTEGSVHDVSARKAAEQAVAALNQDLERLVEERTHELREKSEALALANQRLTDLDQQKTDFVNSVSHELRTPLTSILGFTKLAARDFSRHFLAQAAEGREQERARRVMRNLEVVVEECGRLGRLINDFLDLARIESGRMDWNDQPTPLRPFLDKVLDGARGMFLDRPGVELRAQVPERLPVLLLDPDRLQQVLLNLLNNAAKFTTRGAVTLEAEAGEGSVLLRVRDTGPGIPPEALARVFDSFYQAPQWGEDGNKYPGAGLGLAISRQIVEHYAGRIGAESVLGQGSVFTVELPLPPGAAAANGQAWPA